MINIVPSEFHHMKVSTHCVSLVFIGVPWFVISVIFGNGEINVSLARHPLLGTTANITNFANDAERSLFLLRLLNDSNYPQLRNTFSF